MTAKPSRRFANSREIKKLVDEDHISAAEAEVRGRRMRTHWRGSDGLIHRTDVHDNMLACQRGRYDKVFIVWGTDKPLNCLACIAYNDEEQTEEADGKTVALGAVGRDFWDQRGNLQVLGRRQELRRAPGGVHQQRHHPGRDRTYVRRPR